MSKIIRPDYDNCILNVISSILKHFGAHSEYPSIEAIDRLLLKGYKNIVLMVFDGMGADMLENNLPPESFLRSNIKQQITSVFPSTTTAAMTAYYSGLSPNEHGWLGWSLFFKEFNGCIDTFTNEDSFSKVKCYNRHAAYTLMPYKTIFQMIDEADGSVRSYAVIPEVINLPEDPNVNVRVKKVEQIFESIRDITKKPGRKFVMSYWDEPDSTMHEQGCYAADVKAFMKLLDILLQRTYKELDDTLVIISADHGQINVAEEIYLDTIPEIDECLIMPPSMEPRAASLFVKHGMEKLFEERFHEYFNNDFILFPKEIVLDSGILGKGNSHKKVSDFIGNYLACGISNKLLRYRTITSEKQIHFKGHHAGLTEEEMIVPLIVLE